MAFRADRVSFDAVAALQESLGCPEPLAWVLVRRGLVTPEAAREFLASDGPLDDPEEIPGISEAADRLAVALKRGERVVIHGDYDCDGISSTAILFEALEARGGNVGAFLPSRFTDGYGVSVATVERLSDDGCQLLVCVDCGTTAVEALTRARDLGMDAIVCDHHLAGGLRPPAILANPALGRGSEALPAAAGVTFKLVQALARRVDHGLLAPPPETALDLVALATVADAVPLIGENRRLVARGLAILREGERPGIAALCRAAGVSIAGASARTLGFTIAPAINAAGRLSHPDRALKLLLSRDLREVEPIAVELWSLNSERRSIERDITAQAIAMIEESEKTSSPAALVVVGQNWHEGVVGIVASRLVERFGRPALVLAEVDGEVAKGSGRSLPGVDLHALVAGASGRLTRWGGHQGAVGVQLAARDVAGFAEELAAVAEPVRAAIERARVRVVDAVVGVRELGLDVAEALETLAPFGRGNPDIALLVPGCQVEQTATVGDGHRVLRLRGSGAHARAICFAGRGRAVIEAGRPHDAIVRLGVGRWQDTVAPDVVVEELGPVEVGGEPLRGACAPACTIECPARIRLPRTPAALGRGEDDGSVARIRDRRGEGSVVPIVAALAGADGGVVMVVSDVARRRRALEEILEPSRFGVEAVLLVGARCDRAEAEARRALARGGPVLAMMEYGILADFEIPTGAHVVLVDPPTSPREWRAAEVRALGSWLHLTWGPAEADVARSALHERLDLRPAATVVWRALQGARERPWGDDLDGDLLGTEGVMRHPEAVSEAIAALAELGLVSSGGSIARIPSASARPLAESARAKASAKALEAGERFIASCGVRSGDPLPGSSGVGRGIVSV